MEFFAIIFWLTILALAGLFAYRKIKKDSAPALPHPPAQGESLGATLHELSARIESFSLKTIHPREYLLSPDFKKAVELFAGLDADTIRQYATSGNRFLASAAFEALSRHAERDAMFNPVIMHLHALWPDPLHYALRYIASLHNRPPFGAPVVRVQEWWNENGLIAESFRDYFAQRESLGDAPVFDTYLEWGSAASPILIQNFLARVQHPAARVLSDAVQRWQAQRVDHAFLSTFGRFWGGPGETLVEPDRWKDGLNQATQAILAIPARSILVTGAPRIGKSAFLKLMGARLLEKNWRVFEAGAPDLMAGQIYFGELEGRVRRVVEELQAGKRVAWCVTDLLQFAESGTHKGQSASLLDQIMPALVTGKLVILAEASPDGANRLLQMHPSLRTQLEIYQLQPFKTEELAELAGKVANEVARPQGVRVEPQAVTAALQLSQQYLGGGNLPGIVVDLIKRAIQHTIAAKEKTVTPDAMMSALSQITGLPIAILDDKQRVDLAGMRAFFSERVIGQDEAVGAVVDRIAMLKAGLTDPNRPVGVFLFAGPTGTGKTELAKALASFLFASPERMARLDMSEFQSADSIAKIVGERGTAKSADPLIERIRKQPFSVILLDEFEKAHPNVWDLFLQIFDDGRLTDANGHVADFRHTIIILTSNLGATDHRTAGIGFNRGKDDYAEGQVLAAVSRAFRPEFVNRLDKIVVFKPLSRELMRQILAKELRLVLERRGLRNRDWVVEWEQSAMEFLLDKGFSPEMGARPLKRAIDQYLLAPLASTLVEHRFPQGDQFLFVRSNGKAIEVEFVDPDAELPAPQAAADSASVSLPSMILQPQGSSAESAALTARLHEISARLESAQWNELKDAAMAQAGAPGIWSDPNRHAVFARVTLFDRVNEAMRTAERLKRRLDSGRTRSGQPSRELIGRLALQLHLVAAGMEDAMGNAPIDAVLSVEPVLDGGGDAVAARHWCARLERMYADWAGRRHMQTEDLPPLMHVSGFGAFRTLEPEAGLHILEDDKGRVTARVRIVKGPDEEPRHDQAMAIYAGLIARSGDATAIVRRYRENPAPLVRDARLGWRSGRLDMVLGGDFDLIGMVE